MSRLDDFRRRASQTRLPSGNTGGCMSLIMLGLIVYFVFTYILSPSEKWFAENASFVLVLVALCVLFLFYTIYRAAQSGWHFKPFRIVLILGFALWYYGGFAIESREKLELKKQFVGSYKQTGADTRLVLTEDTAEFTHSSSGNQVSTTYELFPISESSAQLYMKGITYKKNGTQEAYSHRFTAHWEKEKLVLKDDEGNAPDFVFVRQ